MEMGSVRNKGRGIKDGVNMGGQVGEVREARIWEVEEEN